jgi:hypothetical protein
VTYYAIRTAKGYLARQGDTSWFQSEPTGWALFLTEDYAQMLAEEACKPIHADWSIYRVFVR